MISHAKGYQALPLLNSFIVVGGREWGYYSCGRSKHPLWFIFQSHAIMQQLGNWTMHVQNSNSILNQFDLARLSNSVSYKYKPVRLSPLVVYGKSHWEIPLLGFCWSLNKATTNWKCNDCMCIATLPFWNSTIHILLTREHEHWCWLHGVLYNDVLNQQYKLKLPLNMQKNLIRLNLLVIEILLIMSTLI